ncbi:MAG: PilZ domain-containing protein [Parasphingorhabdus sp.]|nr:PilZ domain-containing protein [Parasphingorhabdus sp.]
MTVELIRERFFTLPPAMKPPVHDVPLYDDRCAPRHKIKIPATLRFAGTKGFAIDVVDLSIAGFAAETLLSTWPGTICWITLPGLSALRAEVVRNDGFLIGCAFANLMNPAVLDALLARHPELRELETQN